MVGLTEEAAAMKVYDISLPVTEDMPVYKGKPEKRPVFGIASDFATGQVYETRLEMNLHTGTHLDAARHVFPQGGTVDGIALCNVVCKCKVLDLLKVPVKITAEDLAVQDIGTGDFILLKTRNSYQPVLEGQFVYLAESGAKYLADKKVCGVGIDALGIERDQPGHPVHRLLLGAGMPVLEGLNLKAPPAGSYLLIAAPIHIIGVEAAPVRALLLEQAVTEEIEFMV